MRLAFGFGTVVFAEESGAGAAADDTFAQVGEVSGGDSCVVRWVEGVIELFAQFAPLIAEAGKLFVVGSQIWLLVVFGQAWRLGQAVSESEANTERLSSSASP